MHPHLPRDVGQHLVSVFEFDAEHGVGEGFDDRALQYDRIFLRFRQSGASPDGLGRGFGHRRAENRVAGRADGQCYRPAAQTESAPRRMTFKNVDCELGFFFIDGDVMVGRSRCDVGTPKRGVPTVSWFVLGYLQRIEGLNWPFR